MAWTAAEGCKELRSANGGVRRERKRRSDCKQEDVTADLRELADAVPGSPN